jgi:hypothetical protein
MKDENFFEQVLAVAKQIPYRQAPLFLFRRWSSELRH